MLHLEDILSIVPPLGLLQVGPSLIEMAIIYIFAFFIYYFKILNDTEIVDVKVISGLNLFLRRS